MPEQPEPLNGESQETSSKPSWRITRKGGGIATALLVAIVSSVGAGLGTRALGVFSKDEPLVTASEELQFAECGTPLFLRREHIPPLDEQSSENGWESFFRDNDARLAGASVVAVSIQGETQRAITLKRIDFRVERKPRPRGAVFANPCGDGIYGRYVSVDLDREPPRIVRSESQESYDGSQRPPKAIKFPWVVSVDDPLQLQIEAHTDRCFCTWSARVFWASGGKSGVLNVDNGGEGYDVVGVQGLKLYGPQGAGVWEARDDFRFP